ncbi:MmgE/PrpD family protein [Noviherbaspirillum sedimenti]|uniref:MmgE/PrpD family protein n=1 Tax=Noviherbaspirillum sedimenti TaxID=2320865 RepID=A0A3A3G447_9BURK|nr:MmgE/PrpD family protein [Noviherbaspirillum sedimenti]RJG03257.1 MmgE/PrpD family protein [Noviherbaspirillum sedimenti]
MPSTIVKHLADFTTQSTYDRLPKSVVNECKRILLDSIGCALAALDTPKGRAGIEYGRISGSANCMATIIGTGDRVSVLGAAFANGELINSLDMDAILPPGHVTPYVLPGALAVAEAVGASGRELISAIAVSHEMSFRFGKAMDYVRDVKDGKTATPKVFGYSSTIFGATAAIVMLKDLPIEVRGHALGIAGSIAPVNSHRAWGRHAPSTTIKYLLAGALAQSALTAAYMAELGHRGDVQILDDREFGFPRFIGTNRWEPERITKGLGNEWLFPAEQSYKPYPHCRLMHALFDCLIQIVEDNDIQPNEIDSIKAWVEGIAEEPAWLLREIEHVIDAQFSMSHGLAVAAHRIPPGKAWQDPELVFSRTVRDLMAKITTEVHPDYVQLLTNNGASRPGRIELRARGKTFVAESRYPKGSPSPEPGSMMTTDEIIQKFRSNANGVISPENIEGIIHSVMNLESIANVGTMMRMVGTTAAITRDSTVQVPVN